MRSRRSSWPSLGVSAAQGNLILKGDREKLLLSFLCMLPTYLSKALSLDGTCASFHTAKLKSMLILQQAKGHVVDEEYDAHGMRKDVADKGNVVRRPAGHTNPACMRAYSLSHKQHRQLREEDHLESLQKQRNEEASERKEIEHMLADNEAFERKLVPEATHSLAQMSALTMGKVSSKGCS